MATSHEYDLPLLANTDKIQIRHFVLELECDFEQRTFSGAMLAFLSSRKSSHDLRNMHVFSLQEFQAAQPDSAQCASIESNTSISSSSPLSVSSSSQKLSSINGPDYGKLNNASDFIPSTDEERPNSFRSRQITDIPCTNKKLTRSEFTSSCLSENTAMKLTGDKGSNNDGTGNNKSQFCIDVFNAGNTSVNCESHDVIGNDKSKSSSATDFHKYSQNSDESYNRFPMSKETSTEYLAECSKQAREEFVIEGGEGAGNRTVLSKTQQFEDAQNIHSNNPNNELFQLILECCDLYIDDVSEIRVPGAIYEAMCSNFSSTEADLRVRYQQCMDYARVPLRHYTEKWCVRIWKENVTEVGCFPRVVRIRYRTRPEGMSLRWTKDQEGKPCVYSAAMYINNRAFFPCQEYGSLCTWQAYLTVPSQAVALMTGDSDGDDTQLSNGMRRFYQQSSAPMPCYTFAVAVGFWQKETLIQKVEPVDRTQVISTTCLHDTPCHIRYSSDRELACRFFAPPSLLSRFVAEFRDYFPRCSGAIQEILGACPSPRVDFLLYPDCSQDMAMTNPNLIFLSQSLLAGDGSLCIKLAHELSHFWFGLLIGAKDWTEEWLSEGFATFVEDPIHAKTMGWTEQELKEHSELRALLRFKNLQGEMVNTQEHLQILRPNQGKEHEKATDSIMYVKDGLNPYKLFTQVHYLKGYFLLRYLADLVGWTEFLQMIKQYITRYHGHLVLSQNFLEFMFEFLPQLRDFGISVESIYKDWLDCPGKPKCLEQQKPSPDNTLYNQVIQEADKWKKWEAKHRRKKKKRKAQKTSDLSDFQQLYSDQLVLLLENVMEMKTMSVATLTDLESVHNLTSRNAEVRHRWCELIIKYQYVKRYDQLRTFLINEQAMGVYLYGEMIISGCKTLATLAKDCFSVVGPEMEKTTYKTVHAMLYGS